MAWKPIHLQAGVAAAILVGSTVLGLIVLPIHGVKPGRLAALVPSAPPPGFNAKPVNAGVQSSSQSTFAAVKAAAKRAPKRTGTYTISWNSKTSGDSASILLSLVPTEGEGSTLLGQAKKAALAANAYQSDSYKYESALAVSGVPGGAGALYAPTSSSVKQQLAVAVVPYRNAVAVLYVDQTANPATVKANALALAQSEYGQLQRRLPGFTLAVTRWPTLGSAIWASVSVVLAVAVLAVPGAVRRARIRRELARQEAARKLVLARGSKIARRRAAPKR